MRSKVSLVREVDGNKNDWHLTHTVLSTCRENKSTLTAAERREGTVKRVL